MHDIPTRSYYVVFGEKKKIRENPRDLLLLETTTLNYAEPHSSVGSAADLRTRGRWFDPRLGQYSFRGLMTAIETGFILLLPQWLCGKSASGLERIL